MLPVKAGKCPAAGLRNRLCVSSSSSARKQLSLRSSASNTHPARCAPPLARRLAPVCVAGKRTDMFRQHVRSVHGALWTLHAAV